MSLTLKIDHTGRILSTDSVLEMAEHKPWAQLVSLTDLTTEPILIKNDIFTFGRAKNCDMCFAGNKMVSGNHCRIEREGGVWLYDSSTNGTLINLKHKVHKHKRQLKHGDEIHIIYKKNEPDVNVGFVFQDIEEMENENSSEQTLEYSSELDQTQEVENDVEMEDSEGENPAGAQKEKPEKQDMKKRKLDENENAETKHDKTDAKEAVSPSKIAKTPSLNTAAAREGWGEGAKKAFVAPASTSDPYEDNLVCTICQEIFHDCVSLQPCMHSFCGGCYSDWMKRSRECPTCRKKVERISKNHLIKNMVEAFVKLNPDKARTEEERKELDEKNQIKENMAFPSDKVLPNDSDDESYDSETVFSDDEDEQLHPFDPFTRGYGMQIAVPRTVCRTCPGYTGRIEHSASFIPFGSQSATSTQSQGDDDPGEGTSSGAAGTSKRSLPDGKIMLDAPGFVCDQFMNHILCQCCLEPMPDVRNYYREDDDDPARRPLVCKICDRTFCHAFWGCRKSSCAGCIARFKDLTFDPVLWKSLIMNNPTESAIMKQYAESKGMTMRDFLQECLERLDNKKYKFTAAVFNLSKITSGSSVCYGCGQRLFSDLAVQYMMDIPKEELPDEAKNRPDCYWGRNCRTQVKPHHAQKFNHLCEQTRH